MKKPVRTALFTAMLMAAFASAPAFASPDAFHDYEQEATSTSAGAVATHSFKFSNHFVDNSTATLPAAQARIVVTFPAGYDLTNAQFDAAASKILQGDTDNISFADLDAAPTTLALPGNAVWDFTARTLTITGLNDDVVGTTGGGPVTGFLVVLTGVKNPSAAGPGGIEVRFDRDLNNDGNWTRGAYNAGSSLPITIPPGIDLTASPAAPRIYAQEIIASATAPATLTNGGELSLRTSLGYNFSAGEVRYVRLECDSGLRFLAGSAVSYEGVGAASVGAVNGLGTNAITFSITAGDNDVVAADYLSISGSRAITRTSAPVNCSYSLYDFPSQAQAGGSAGRVVLVNGQYIDFAPSTVFTVIAATATADVEATPSFSQFLPNWPTTLTRAALSQLTYDLASPAPLTVSGIPVILADLHAVGASGTRVVVGGDFTAAANAGNTYTGAALNRVFLSGNNSDCSTVGLAASSLSATQATFNVGATATQRVLCLQPRTGVAVPAASYTATLDAAPAQPTVYAVSDIGPLAAGRIVRNGTELQAPLVQIPGGWIARVVLTNTGAQARPYTISVLTEEGRTFEIASSKLSGTVPATGTQVIELNSADLASGSGLRGTLVVNVAGPDAQIQGLYQIVNPTSGLVNNHVLVRPGKN